MHCKQEFTFNAYEATLGSRFFVSTQLLNCIFSRDCSKKQVAFSHDLICCIVLSLNLSVDLSFLSGISHMMEDYQPFHASSSARRRRIMLNKKSSRSLFHTCFWSIAFELLTQQTVFLHVNFVFSVLVYQLWSAIAINLTTTVSSDPPDFGLAAGLPDSQSTSTF